MGAGRKKTISKMNKRKAQLKLKARIKRKIALGKK